MYVLCSDISYGTKAETSGGLEVQNTFALYIVARTGFPNKWHLSKELKERD